MGDPEKESYDDTSKDKTAEENDEVAVLNNNGGKRNTCLQNSLQMLEDEEDSWNELNEYQDPDDFEVTESDVCNKIENEIDKDGSVEKK